ncbi:DoxX family protein [Mucilaginibacter terrae]|uniref:DoxX family protein n=1 Tax=Mucilaginibacter terrae TaxID=1955052 RepID=A0ABU3GTS3_9SPHI|nr:DoxX family protein [Mucilaginibacter terrae]MDT3403186.1 hypothetical protein [Mucilaginibacter terrae]
MDSTFANAASPWPLAQKLAFRFFVIFFPVFIFFNPNGAVPLLSETYESYIQPMHGVIVWSAAHILHLPYPITVFTNGSGDTSYDYLVLLFCVVVSFVVAVIWSAVNRKDCNYDKLYYWLTVILRFYVGITMLSYGAVKVIKLQFPYPGLGRLLQPYGNSSPMGLAWTFMGFSKGYNYFTGFAELTCGILLLFRRTALLGAVISLVVAANIMAINYCFDVPVKILSTMLVVMTLFLLFRDIDRFVNFFFLHREAQSANLSPKRFKKRWKNITLITIKYLLIAYVSISTAENCFASVKTYGDAAPKPALYGIYETQSFVRNHDTLAPLTTDTTRWRRLVIGYKGYARVYLMNDSTRNFAFEPDTVRKTVYIYQGSDTTKKFMLKYTMQKPDILTIKGKLMGDSVSIRLKRYDEKQFTLTKRGFHWVNEYPFNR